MLVNVAKYTSGGSRGEVWGNCPPKPQWRPFAINAPLYGALGSRNRFENSLKYTMFFAWLKVKVYDFAQLLIE